MLTTPQKESDRRLRPAHLGLRAWHRAGCFSEIIRMNFKYVVGLVCAVSFSFFLTGPTLAQDKTVKIGAIYPLSGNWPICRASIAATCPCDPGMQC